MTPIDLDTVLNEPDEQALADILDLVEEDLPEDLLHRFRRMAILRSFLYRLMFYREGKVRAADDPRIMDLSERMNLNLRALHVLGIEDELRKIKVPHTEPGDILMHGRVTDEMAFGLEEGLMIAFSDSRGNRVDLENVEVGPFGYFAAVIDSAKAKKLAEEGKETLNLTVMNTKGEICYRMPTSLKVEGGARVWRDITLSPGDLKPADVGPKPKPARPVGPEKKSPVRLEEPRRPKKPSKPSTPSKPKRLRTPKPKRPR